MTNVRHPKIVMPGNMKKWSDPYGQTIKTCVFVCVRSLQLIIANEPYPALINRIGSSRLIKQDIVIIG